MNVSGLLQMVNRCVRNGQSDYLHLPTGTSYEANKKSLLRGMLPKKQIPVS